MYVLGKSGGSVLVIALVGFNRCMSQSINRYNCCLRLPEVVLTFISTQVQRLGELGSTRRRIVGLLDI
jgi:hypothetical protein